MKKLLVIAIAAALAGCEQSVEPTQAPNDSISCVRYGIVDDTIYSKVTIEGHDYIMARGLKRVSIVHSESCPCRNAELE